MVQYKSIRLKYSFVTLQALNTYHANHNINWFIKSSIFPIDVCLPMANIASIIRYYDELVSEGVLEHLTANIENIRHYDEGTSHYVARNGSGSIVKHFLKQCKAKPQFEHHISEINEQDGKW